MAQPYIGEIRCFGFTFAPYGWMFCNGQLLDISLYNPLYSILGTIYGGNGTTNFALPNLQGQVPMHWGNGAGGFTTVIGEVQGVSSVTLTTSQIPQHNHTIVTGEVPSGGTVERTPTPSSTAYISNSAPDGLFSDSAAALTATFSPKAIGFQGSSQPHENMQPYLVMNFCIAVDGIFPSRN
jgi:microcystin-dependent protein